ncbi:hypothetical protein EDB19DRAFT_1668710 [Suillus lakei]|nr:hypothetical protein EDB19DRAFT_1668710 [Suillus lakei]
MLLADRKQLVKRRNVSRIPNRGFVWCCFFAVSLLVLMKVLAPTRLVAAHRQLFFLSFCHFSSFFPTTPSLTVFNILVRLDTSTYFYTDSS